MDRAELKARARAQLGGGIFQNLWMMGLAVCLLIGLLESAATTILPAIGALIGSIIVGLAVEVSTLLGVPSDLKYATALVALIVILLVRPQGLLGRKERLG